MSGSGTYRWKQDGLASPSVIFIRTLVHLSFLRTAEGTLDLFYLCLQNSLAAEFRSSHPSAETKIPVILAGHLSVSLQRDPGVSSSAAPFPSPL